MPGPAPNPNARRTNNRDDWRTLPSAGRSGEPPAWPMGRASKAVLDLWSQLWSTPQALAWQELGWTRVIARYTKLVLAAEKSSAPVSLLAEVRQLEDRIGLTSKSMLQLRWKVGPVAAKPEPSQLGEVAVLDDYRDLYGAG